MGEIFYLVNFFLSHVNDCIYRAHGDLYCMDENLFHFCSVEVGLGEIFIQ